MKVLFVGGTGIISTACTRLAVTKGMQVTLLNRSRSGSIPGCSQLVADINDEPAVLAAIGDLKWDVVVDFLTFTPEQLQSRLRVFGGRCGQYVYISSASAYQKPPSHYLITESTPLANPYWDYSRNKIACEDLLVKANREQGLAMTIVRPSFTYGDTVFPLAMNSWARSYTVVDRLRRGLPVIIPGDGLTLWTVTHNTDFAVGLVGLFGHQGALGQAVHITSDEVLTWRQIFEATAAAAGVEKPNLVCIPAETLVSLSTGYSGPLYGDKVNSMVFDNSKIKRLVPEYRAVVPYARGIVGTVAWYDADPGRRLVDEQANQEYDRLVSAHRAGLDAARRAYGV